ncbi:hypothetical protein SAMN05192533_102301 [Mesobacillus persicus]|uniref:Phage protein n=1 Tax=Mesobacillus persicus TaxID=930146 RepID=A0A1H7XPB5_9BACI|nr:hypothetical protein [Mesobacillus persicus]SEM35581.1 hypothetical protein SAMN05192533_102301 [Mesobacillus persicus]
MKNTLGDLNLHLFAQLERLGDEEVKGENLSEEINRAKAISDIASRIISNGSLVLEAKKVAENSLNIEQPVPRMLEGK